MSESCDQNSSSEASSHVADRLPNRNHVIRGQAHSYTIGKKIAHGRYGAVYEVLRRGDGRHLAAKLEVCDSHFHGLNMDYIVLRNANRSGLKYMCQLIDRGKIEGHFKFMVMQLLDENLDNLRHEFQGNRFSAPTAIKLGIEMLSALEELHSLGFVHRDVKPANFMVKNEKGQCRLFLVDFGLCKAYRSTSGEVKKPRERAQFRGTVRYASLAAHNEREQAPKDDVESWLYVLTELFTGELPWSRCHRNEKPAVRQLKEHARTSEGTHQLFKYCPRTEFRRIMAYLDGLTFSSTVDYSFLHSLLKLAIKNYEINLDVPYDWLCESSSQGNTPNTPETRSLNGDQADDRPGPSNSAAGGQTRDPVYSKLEKAVQQLNGVKLDGAEEKK
ncbi:putative serine/threonine-protein kinase [Aphelenchoides fujianensis]|nr:putative serine/threonine-protein kinase [Aphelenchoides fujianensis]